MSISVRYKAALKAASLHFGASIGVALLAAALVFGVWYPYPYRELAGGRELFLLIVLVDVVCGPLLTMVMFNPKKPRWELTMDLGFVAMIQVAALLYGVYTLAMARPIYLVYEVDRFRVVSVADVQEGELRPELGGLHRVPWWGPKTIGVRAPRDGEETLKSLDLSLQGNEPSARPDWWVPYEENRQQAKARAQSIEVLKQKHPAQKNVLEKAVWETGRKESDLKWLPLTGFKSSEWVALVDAVTADVVGFAPIDGF